MPVLEEESGLKAGRDFYLGHCPERVMSGRLLYNLTNYDRVVGGLNKKSTKIMIDWYSKIVQGKLHPTDMTSAEVVKTAENAYRDVQIAFANEVGLICEKLGLDAFEVRRLVNTCPFRDMHLPGAGVGGHCLPKDPWLLVYGGREAKPKLIPAARRVNDGMPLHVVELIADALKEAGLKMNKETCIAILGFSFLDNSGDTRNSPSKIVIDSLKKKTRVVVHDPFVKDNNRIGIESNLERALRKADCAVLMTKHKIYSDMGLKKIADLLKHRIVIDGRNAFSAADAEKFRIIYRGIGKG